MQVIRDVEAYFNSIPDDVETINVSYSNIPYIPPLHRFTHLRRFYCRSNRLTSLPPLPPTLLELDCNYNLLTELPTPLPPNLEELYCDFNILTHLPASLPNSLRGLRCKCNELKTLPPFPRLLNILYADENRLTSLPPFPPRLEIVSFNNNSITELPAFPPYLRSLSCISNALFTFPSIEGIPLTNVDLLGNPITRVLNIQERGSYGTNAYYLRIIRVLWRFRFLYWCLRWKRSFHRWLWASRENRIRSLYHPHRIGSLLLNAGEDEEDWINIFSVLS